MDTGIHTQCGDLQASLPSPVVADLIIAYLGQIGVEYVFGTPGDVIGPLYDALARSSRRGGPKPIIACHETGAAFMADGYARETGKPGVCYAASGPGTTNLITGVACACENGVPMLLLTEQPSLETLGKYGVQDFPHTGIDTLSMFRHCTRYNTLVSHTRQVETKLVNAFHKALQVPRGPAHLGFPVDILRSRISTAIPSYNLSSLLRPSSIVDENALDLLLKMIEKAKNVVLLIGGWCEEAIGVILQFAARRGASFVTTQDGKALAGPHHPLFRGIFGHGGHMSADAALQDPAVDLILAVGFRMDERTCNGLNVALLGSKALVHIDESEEHLHRTPMAMLHVRGRILTIFQLLVEYLCDDADSERTLPLPNLIDATLAGPQPIDSDQAAKDALSITPRRLMHDLGQRLPLAIRYLGDSGNALARVMRFLQPRDRRVADRRLLYGGRQGTVDRRGKDSGRLGGGRLRIAMDFAPMGYAIGAAVGTAMGNRKIPVVCITSADCMLMNGQGISVAVAERLTVIYVVLNEAGTVVGTHRGRFPIADFAAFARSLGAHAHILRTPQDLQDFDFDAICRRNGPTLLDVYIDIDEVPPAHPSQSEILAAADQP